MTMSQHKGIGSFENICVDLLLKIGDYLDLISLYYWALTNHYLLQCILKHKYFYDVVKLKEPKNKNQSFFSFFKKQSYYVSLTNDVIIQKMYENNPQEQLKDLLDYAVQLNQSNECFKLLLAEILQKNPKDTAHILTKALIDAIKHRSIDTIIVLLQLTVFPELDHNSTGCPLYHAMQEGQTDIIDILLKFKPKKISPSDNFRCLSVAAKNNHLEAIKMFVNFYKDNGLNIDAKGVNDETPLFIAAEKGHAEICQFLLNNGARNDACLYFGGFTPLYVAAEKGYSKVIEVLCNFKDVDINFMNPSACSALYVAVQNNHRDSVEILSCQPTCNINLCRVDGKYSPLYLACSQGNLSIVEILLKNGADVNLPTANQATPLHAAVCRGYVDIVNILIKYDANVNACFNDGFSPLHCAAVELKIEAMPVIAALIKAGANLLACTQQKNYTAAAIANDPAVENILFRLEEIMQCGLQELANDEFAYPMKINMNFIIVTIKNFIENKIKEDDVIVRTQAENCLVLLQGAFTPFGYAVILYALIKVYEINLKSKNIMFYPANCNRTEFIKAIVHELGFKEKISAKHLLYLMLNDSLLPNQNKNLFNKLHEYVINPIMQIFNGENKLTTHLFHQIILCLNLYETKTQPIIQYEEEYTNKKQYLGHWV